jgi:hypothetical protein
MAAPTPFSMSSLVTRWLIAGFLVFGTYNPSGHSYIHWLFDGSDGRWSLKALVGVSLIIAILTFAYATLRAIGVTGVLTALTFFGVAIWAMVDNGLLDFLGVWAWVTIVLGVVASILAIGVSWSHVRARLSGQSDSNDVTL